MKIHELLDGISKIRSMVMTDQPCRIIVNCDSESYSYFGNGMVVVRYKKNAYLKDTQGNLLIPQIDKWFNLAQYTDNAELDKEALYVERPETFAVYDPCDCDEQKCLACDGEGEKECCECGTAIKCDQCDGDGVICNCQKCGGDGYIEIREPLVSFADKIVRKSLIDLVAMLDTIKYSGCDGHKLFFRGTVGGTEVEMIVMATNLQGDFCARRVQV